jgi:enoyl-CoA hydratase/carnithine racemase
VTRDVETGSSQVVADVDAGAGRIVFDNPAHRNALTLAMLQATTRALMVFADDPEVEVVVVSGRGDRAFVSGADIVEYEASRATASARAAYDDVLDAFWAGWDRFTKPVVAMIRGACIGGGLYVALKADVRIASPDSQFAAAAAALGAGLPTWAVDALRTTVGPAYASELLFSARPVSAAEALTMGLVNRVVPGSELTTTVLGLARQIVAVARPDL